MINKKIEKLLFLPIYADESKNLRFSEDPECVEILKLYPDHYKKVGFNLPWIGYFMTFDGIKMVGCGGYKGKPRNGKVEIAYGTFKKYEGRGIGTEICRQLVLLALQTNPKVRITARTLMTNYSSIKILRKNFFEFSGMVNDEDDGYVWEWEFRKPEK
jgi:[ribosomal protein S5]-alanine N-acetyltransferase